MAKKAKRTADLSTEEKIKEAARTVFMQKGYAGTRTRDIAEKAGINLALLNYYFRSKEKLFEQVMLEKVQQLFGTVLPILNDPSSSLETKVKEAVSRYIDMLQEHPDLPIFVLSEIRKNAGLFKESIPGATLLKDLYFFRQLKEAREDIHPLHFLMSLLGMTIFPFVARPILDSLDLVAPEGFHKIMQERKELIPEWIMMMIRKK